MGSQREKKGKAPSTYPSLIVFVLWIESIQVHTQTGNSPSATPIQHTSVRGFLGTDFARETPQNHLQQLGQNWELTASTGAFLIPRHPLATTAVISQDPWQVSVTSEATTLGKTVTRTEQRPNLTWRWRSFYFLPYWHNRNHSVQWPLGCKDVGR